MLRSKGNSFVHELLIRTNPQKEKELLTRFGKGGDLYNACLGHCLSCIDLIRQSKDFKKSKNKSDRSKRIKDLRKKIGYSEFALHRFAKTIAKNAKFNRHLDAFSIQKVATRAYLASEEYFYNKRGRPRYKSRNRMRSIEGKSNGTGIRFKDGKVVWNILKGKPLVLDVVYDLKDKYGIEAHALSCKIKYCRIIYKEIKGKKVWYLQLILEGSPKMKKNMSKGVVGLDIGPSTIAICSDKKALLEPFCQEIKKQGENIRLLERRIDKSRRATNPENYNEDKTVKKKKQLWKKSNNYKKYLIKIKENQRKLRETRKKAQNRKVNELLQLGDVFRLEKLSYKGFQKRYGKSVNKRAPGLFVQSLRRKAESAGGKVEEFSTYKTKLSQTCHCGKIEKKSLSKRWHSCDCGVKAQRDLYSAFLAKYVIEDSLDMLQAQRAWTVEEPLLEHAISRLNELAKGETRLSSFGLGQRQSQSHVRKESLYSEAEDVVSNLLRASENCIACP